MQLKPFFTYYGGKWRCAALYPVPEFDTIVEPFAGSAGYSLRHPDRRVVLVEKNEQIAGIWRYLVRVSTDEIAALPDLDPGQKAKDLAVCQEAQWLVGMWLNKGSDSPRQTPSAWMRSGVRSASYWGPEIRARIAAQVSSIRHWQVICGDYTSAPNIEATWFIDPPYQNMGKHYRHGSKDLDFDALAAWSMGRRGQSIVCENAGASWLPFRHLAATKANPGNNASGFSDEVIWTNIEERQRSLF